MILPDSSEKHTIHLGEGTYSNEANEETFPIIIPGFIALEGVNESLVVLNASANKTVIKLVNNPSVTISGITISGGSGENGGGMYCINSNVNINKTFITGNSADGYGGGIYSVSSKLWLKDSNVSGNNGNYGGGIYTEYSEQLIENSFILENIAYEGAGIYSTNHSNVQLKSVLMSGNTAVDMGGAIYCVGSDLTITNATVTDNKGSSGGAIFGTGCNTITMINSIFWNDLPQEIYYKPLVNLAGPKIITVRWTDVEGGPQAMVTNSWVTVNWLEGAIDVDPDFTGSGEHPYSLTWSSPCKDAGTPDTTGLSLPPDDIVGNLRLWDGDWNGIATIDMGAYEYGSVPVGTKEPVVTDSFLKLFCFPNPYRESTKFEYLLSTPCHVTLTILNQHGQDVVVLVNEFQHAGRHRATWNTGNLPSGIYNCLLKSENQIISRRTIKL